MTAIFLTVLAVALLLPQKWRQKTGPAALSCASLAAFAVLAGGGSMHDALLCILCPLAVLLLPDGRGRKT